MASPYLTLIALRMRSQTAYRGSFAIEVAASLGATATGLAELYVIFANVPVLGGLTFDAALLVFALGHVAFSLADLVVGHLDTLPTYLRAGTLDAFLLRPLPVLAQLVTDDLSLRRLGRTAAGSVIAGVALARTAPGWSAYSVGLVALTIVSGAAIFAALFVGAAAVQFWMVDGAEFTSSFVYGGSYAAQFPTSIFTAPLRVLFTFVVPAAFTAYLPVLTLLGLPGPFPSWIGWCTPVAAAGAWAVALLGWRAGLRHYTGTGS
ncbi:ABC-2 family transporter protein [Dactylosporangium sp. AC04546]|uniref:ABC transporter permease n=1 Tax=Dactylosporangium sp. AC04546 TaxID=2862460 RepID=UPI001EDEDBB6|nr:ABC-2 family transporter protein [Dactylosporangium sp. AC04546]WVK81878.1 ABC-2 family transporter protein [Dactylosporangium sp. AC04546]